MEMYRALVDEPLVDRPLSLYPLDEYAAEVRAYRRSQWWRRWVRRGKRPASLPVPPPAAAAPLVPANQILPALPEGAIFGYIDSLNGASRIDARSRDRIALFGWAASRAAGAPLRTIRILLGERTLGEVTDFHARPDVVSYFGRPELLKSGWRTMVYLPALGDGEYQIRVEAVDRLGNQETLGPVWLRIGD